MRDGGHDDADMQDLMASTPQVERSREPFLREAGAVSEGACGVEEDGEEPVGEGGSGAPVVCWEVVVVIGISGGGEEVGSCGVEGDLLLLMREGGEVLVGGDAEERGR